MKRVILFNTDVSSSYTGDPDSSGKLESRARFLNQFKSWTDVYRKFTDIIDSYPVDEIDKAVEAVYQFYLKGKGGGSTVYGWVDTKDIQKIQSTVTCRPKEETIDKNDIVEIKPGSTWYSGKKIGSWVIKKQWIVKEVNGNRVVIDKSTDGKNAICSPIHINNLKLIKKK